MEPSENERGRSSSYIIDVDDLVILVARLAKFYHWPQQDIFNLRLTWALELRKAAEVLDWSDWMRTFEVIQQAQHGTEESVREWMGRILPDCVSVNELDEDDEYEGLRADPATSPDLAGMFKMN